MKNLVNFTEAKRSSARITSDKPLLVTIAVDTSGTMIGFERSIQDMIAQICSELKKNAETASHVELCVVLFDDDPYVYVPFSNVEDVLITDGAFDCGGMTSTHAAVNFCINELNARILEYKDAKVPCYKPYFFLISDGQSNDDDNGEYGKLLDMQRKKKVDFIPIGLGDQVDFDELRSMHVEGLCLSADKNDFSGIIKLVTMSCSSSLNPDTAGMIESCSSTLGAVKKGQISLIG